MFVLHLPLVNLPVTWPLFIVFLILLCLLYFVFLFFLYLYSVALYKSADNSDDPFFLHLYSVALYKSADNSDDPLVSWMYISVDLCAGFSILHAHLIVQNCPSTVGGSMNTCCNSSLSLTHTHTQNTHTHTLLHSPRTVYLQMLDDDIMS